MTEKDDTCQQPPEHGWTCFHCWEHFPPTFEGQRKALHHFGPTPDATPGCIEKLTARHIQLPAMSEREDHV